MGDDVQKLIFSESFMQKKRVLLLQKKMIEKKLHHGIRLIFQWLKIPLIHFSNKKLSFFLARSHDMTQNDLPQWKVRGSLLQPHVLIIAQVTCILLVSLFLCLSWSACLVLKNVKVNSHPYSFSLTKLSI